MTDIEHLANLEQRVRALEMLVQGGELLRSETLERKEKELVDKYGEHVDKSTAAKILGVTRATVYTMLKDGRTKGACEGKRVDVRSIARYIYSEKPKNRRNRHGLDTLEEA